MRQKTEHSKDAAVRNSKDSCRQTRKRHSAKQKVRIGLGELGVENSNARLRPRKATHN